MKRLLALAAAAPAIALAVGGKVPLDTAPIKPHDKASLQRGAAIFVNHCLNCHSAGSMRYLRLQDLGLTEQQIRDNLLFTADKVGEAMTTAQDAVIMKSAFGVVPPDLSLAARSRSADWLYTYLRSFYRDPESRTGWNNRVFNNVAMPHVLWQYQGRQVLNVTERMDQNTGDLVRTAKLALESAGKLTPIEYDQYVADLVNYLVYMAEPAQTDRKLWGILVLFFLGGFVILALMLKNEYWQDVR